MLFSSAVSGGRLYPTSCWVFQRCSPMWDVLSSSTHRLVSTAASLAVNLALQQSYQPSSNSLAAFDNSTILCSRVVSRVRHHDIADQLQCLPAGVMEPHWLCSTASSHTATHWQPLVTAPCFVVQFGHENGISCSVCLPGW